jgi:putative endonuclease
MATHNDTGNKGELLAANYLQEKGYEILKRNYRWKRYELDLIAKKDDLLVFVEVKTKTSTKFGQPEASVTQKKASQLMVAAEQYIFEINWNKPIRFDIIAIIITKESIEIEHLIDAFY